MANEMIKASITVRVDDGERATERVAFDPCILRDPQLVFSPAETMLDLIWRRSIKPTLLKQINEKAGV